MNSNVTKVLLILLIGCFSVHNAFADSETDYAAYINTLDNLQDDDFTKIVIEELTEYPFLFPNAADLDDLHFRLSAIYFEKDKEVESFFTHLQFIFLYPNSEHLTTVKDRLRSLLLEEGDFEPVRDKVESMLNPFIADTTRHGRYYAFIKNLVEYDLEPVNELLVQASQRFIDTFPNSSKKDEVIFWRAEFLAKNEEFERALAEHMKLTFLFNKSLYVSASKLKMADIFTEELDMHENAIVTLEEFLLEYPDDPQAAYAQMYMAKIIEEKKKKYLEAINAYKMVAIEYPQSLEAVPALFEAARLYEDKFDEYDQAIRVYNQIVREFPTDMKAPYALAEAARIYEKELDDYHNAVSVYFKVYGHYPESQIAPESLYAAAEISQKKLENYERA
ncbi:tetratricopeptide repeat protein, partial [candidate division KSB1 bacterium]|nr:tetratricopeptide repeat protein [candidate division KSB1 bacterium]